MKDILDQLIDHKIKDKEELLSLIDWLQSFVDIHPVNAINLSKMGGLQILLDIIFLNTHQEAR